MRIKNWSILYTLGYGIVSIGQRTFYKKIQVVGLENIPKNKPVIFASNHQNAFMDPVLIAVNLTKPTYYLVRADVFKKPLVAKIFDSINMMPVYRERDGVDTKEANVAVFERCYDILKKNRPIIIFPEGNHGRLKTLRPLKKGFARIASGAEEKYGSEIDVQIVPVGLNYSDHYNMGADLLVNFGKPIDVDSILTEKDNPRQINELKSVLEKSMSDAIIDIQAQSYYQTIHEMMMMFEHKLVSEDVSLLEKFKKQKEFIVKAEKFFLDNPDDLIEKKTITFKKAVTENGLRYWLFSKEKHNILVSLIGLMLFLPIHVYGVINNYLPYRIPAWFAETKMKDPQFQSSMKMALGVVLFFLFWMIQTLIVGLVTDGYAWWYLLSLPISAWISYHYWIRLLKTKGMMRYNRGTHEQLKKEYGSFKDLFIRITQH
ncbi:MAG: 1-acyl-sn-glycerol-3-phosphate acyltransferase [Flavobacteriales bacterium]|nr:1-acyl-sn-glycerol-3-phosphate acyltransferase [Flavobacteriales bacterium]